MTNTKIITFKNYQSLFPYIEKNGLSIPLSYLNDDKNIDSLVSNFIENFDSVSEYLKANPEIKLVRFVLFDAATYKAYENAVKIIGNT